MSEYRSLFSRVDGLPPLWPKPASWYFDAGMKARVLAKLSTRIPDWLLDSTQRRIDMAYRHFNYLLDQHKEKNERSKKENGGKEKLRTNAKWVGLLCEPVALAAPDRLTYTDASSKCTAEQFGKSMLQHWSTAGYQFSREYLPPTPPIPGKCDVCKRACTSECGCCGESYCSKPCQRKDFKQHRRVCETVFDNNMLSATMTNIEMGMTLTEVERHVALGLVKSEAAGATRIGVGDTCSMCGVEGKFMACAGCCTAYYCSKTCQSSHWKVHRANCNKL